MTRFLALCFAFVLATSGAGAFPQTYDGDASSYFVQLSINGCATPTASFKAAVNAYIIAEKAALNWGNQDAQYILATTDSCTAGTNLAQPTLYKVTWSGSPSFTVQNGLNGDGATVAGDTGVNQSALTRTTQNNSHLDTWMNAANVCCALGLAAGSSGYRVNGTTNRLINLTSSSANGVTDTGAGIGGLYFADRLNSSTVINTGSNGVVQSSGATSASTALISAHVTICEVGVAAFCTNGTNLLFVGFGAPMNNEASHYTNVRNLLLALGVTGI
jgi:hypothetical protein